MKQPFENRLRLLKNKLRLSFHDLKRDPLTNRFFHKIKIDEASQTNDCEKASTYTDGHESKGIDCTSKC